MFKSIWEEIYNSNLTTFSKIIRFIGILFVPFAYGFVYIFSFSNPFSHTQSLDVKVMVQKDDAYAVSYVKQLEKMQDPLKVGNLSFSIAINHQATDNQIYLDPTDHQQFKQEAENISANSYAGLAIAPNLTKLISDSLVNFTQNFDVNNVSQLFTQVLNNLVSSDTFTLYLNYSKNYIIGLGISVATTLLPVYKRAVEGLFATDPSSILDYAEKNNPNYFPGGSSDPKFLVFQQQVQNIWTNAEKFVKSDAKTDSYLDNLSFVQAHSYNPKNTQLGWLIAPFFLIIGLWVGGLATSLAITPKLFNKKRSLLKTYLAKSFALIGISLIQSTIMFVSLYFVGFAVYGTNMLYLLISLWLIGILFSLIIQAIRMMIPNRVLGILVVSILLVIQMSITGGLFGVATTNAFYRAISYIMPTHYGMIIATNALVNFSWATLFINLSYILIATVVFIFPAIFIYKILKTKEINANQISEKTIKIQASASAKRGKHV